VVSAMLAAGVSTLAGADMNERTGPFWDAVEGNAPMPPAAATLGLELLVADPERGEIELAFEAREEWTNPVGNVLGAFVAAMLYDTVGPALLATLAADEFQATEELNVRFLAPLRPGRVTAVGRVVSRDGNLAQLEASLFDAERTQIATAAASARVIPLAAAPEAV
jgi:uncharacterized protein (TIGR00369 family)